MDKLKMYEVTITVCDIQATDKEDAKLQFKEIIKSNLMDADMRVSRQN